MDAAVDEFSSVLDDPELERMAASRNSTAQGPVPSTSTTDIGTDQTKRVAGVGAALKVNPDISETLDYLVGWTFKQDQLTKQMVDHQKQTLLQVELQVETMVDHQETVEAMMRKLLKKQVGGAEPLSPAPSPPRFDGFCQPEPPPLLAQARLASPRAADVILGRGMRPQAPASPQARLASPRAKLPNGVDDVPGSVRSPDDEEVEKPLKSTEIESEAEEVEVADRSTCFAANDRIDESDNWSDHSIGRLHSVFVDAIWHVPAEEDKDHRTWHMQAVESIVENPKFEYFAAIFIFLHSLFIGVSVEYLATVSSNKHPLLALGNVIFVIIFCFEVGIKLAAERQEFFLGHEWKWNMFDMLLISTVFAEFFMYYVFQEKSMKTVVKIAEMVRTIRILRIFRMLKFSLTLRMVVAKILSSFKSLLWILILFALMVYVVAVCLTQGCNDFLAGEQHDVGSDNLMGTKRAVFKYFGSIPRSCFTLFASIAGGLVWADVADILGEVGAFYASMFVFFQALSLVAVMNLITGIFVGNAINSDSDLAMEAEAMVRVQQAEYLRKMFSRMDGDDSDSIAMSEFQNFARNPELEVHLKSLNIDASEAETLFLLLDDDHSGTIQITEFLQGCMELHGPTRSIDMKVMLYEHKRMRHKLTRHITDMHRFANWTKEAIGAMSTVS